MSGCIHCVHENKSVTACRQQQQQQQQHCQQGHSVFLADDSAGTTCTPAVVEGATVHAGAMTMLYFQLGWASFTAIAVLILMMPVQVRLQPNALAECQTTVGGIAQSIAGEACQAQLVIDNRHVVCAAVLRTTQHVMLQTHYSLPGSVVSPASEVQCSRYYLVTASRQADPAATACMYKY
jgi:hypothetical protein